MIYLYFLGKRFQSKLRKHALPVREVANAGISVLVGPPDVDAAELIEALCAELGIVFIKYFWYTKPCGGRQTALNIYPVEEYFNLLIRLVEYWQWERVVLVFAKSSSMRSSLIPFFQRFISFLYVTFKWRNECGGDFSLIYKSRYLQSFNEVILAE